MPDSYMDIWANKRCSACDNMAFDEVPINPEICKPCTNTIKINWRHNGRTNPFQKLGDVQPLVKELFG